MAKLGPRDSAAQLRAFGRRRVRLPLRAADKNSRCMKASLRKVFQTIKIFFGSATTICAWQEPRHEAGRHPGAPREKDKPVHHKSFQNL